MGRIIFVTGGARSGKSRFAQQLAQRMGEHIGYVATAIAFDDEMKDRIAKHKKDRPQNWKTWERYKDVYKIYAGLDSQRGILIDCITVMVSNLLLDMQPTDDGTMAWVDRAEAYITGQVQALLKAAVEADVTTIMVSNEVGLGLVPDNRLGRLFRDIAGRVNQLIASASHDVYLVVSGIPVKIK
ncbi:MAG TPA: bifunctional adenosylcobinamide kinase/adenosylcobinamide-phosphate guanylyltransferase [Clostridiales bacterium]|nr:bifunctional adenosylcobinamide kinase/adenosylcobinamide-phosphate guanylyltransferase [Clostridiales bacterium]